MKTNDAGRINIVWYYFLKTSNANAKHLKFKWKHVEVFDISKEKDRSKSNGQTSNDQKEEYSDPMFVLKGEKL